MWLFYLSSPDCQDIVTVDDLYAWEKAVSHAITRIPTTVAMAYRW
jgi:hypothetical protein